MKNHESKIEKFKKIILLVMIIVMIFFILAFVLQEYNKIISYIIILLCVSIIIGIALSIFIEHSINVKPNENKHFFSCKIKRGIISFITNFLFATFTTIFVFHYSNNLNDPFLLISSQFALILLSIITYFITNIKYGDDISLLKATNYFILFLLTAIKLLKLDVFFLIEYYYVLPIFIIQGLYELFDGKSKRKGETQE
jgi:magnesium-transporting ATPase (P-type)